MESKAKFLGHAIHPVLIVFPLGLLATGVIFDAVYLIWGNPSFPIVSYWMIFAGIIGGIISAPFGWVDWFVIPPATRAKSVGLLHGIGNIIVLLLFIGSWWLRHNNSDMLAVTYILSFAGAGLAGITGWLGGELVDRLSVGVDEGAHVNAPNSLFHRSTK